ncbi:hypothetical protein [Nonomuraea lactucae]|uniref:hypothetical protein n=1 Tax=Nonomuraea lactucae TaxID=2249762 RepID=UPI0013B3930B|nr:hypothetical protein [Nonomuraea lactucae]
MAAAQPLPESYRIYHRLREGVPAGSMQLGAGRNLFRPPPGVFTFLASELSNLTSVARLADYQHPLDEAETTAMAAVLANILGLSGVTADDLFVIEGSSKGISLVFQSVQDSCHTVALPLPTYFAAELSALRRDVPVSCYYRPDTGQVFALPTHPGRPRTLVMETIPNGVTGFVGSRVEDLTEPALTLVDCVFVIGNHPPPWASLSGRDLTRTVITLTASKDFAVPAARAGLLITKNDHVKDVARYDQLESTYSVSLVARRIILLYVLVVAAHHLWESSRATSRGAAQDVLREACAGVGGAACRQVLPPASLIAGIVEHLARMARRYAANWALAQPVFTREGSSATQPQIGYSCLLRLPARVRGHSRGDLVRWVNQVGRRLRLKLNPSLLFGGNCTIWQELYGTEFLLRVNLSDEPNQLRRVLAAWSIATSHPLETGS